MLRDEEPHTKLKNTTAEILVRSELQRHHDVLRREQLRSGGHRIEATVGKGEAGENLAKDLDGMLLCSRRSRSKRDANGIVTLTLRGDSGPGQSGKLPDLLHRPPCRVARWKVEGGVIWAQSQANQDHVPTTAVPAPEPRRLAVIHRSPRLSGRTKGRGSWALSLGRLMADGHKLDLATGMLLSLSGKARWFHEHTAPIDSLEERAPSPGMKPSTATLEA
ncbi:uncharacterized protein TRIVIDRAFT_62351 [Trichoderma virens Gv29-8]|uniref:Uncharacterized protein n=1 Tax=Hypocrea virens (strain Gv29-8 / FGSC 10586) TaxID=413071 RepID=G9MJM1_HYPVG|nr:uncharacterized protein TRIVIDRAFT_62351 [Trichoderma virens Gv29-8]EHK25684.1 hypothetical protein TRIVIDRAFT_62351 [Trichoderma virens Gv29-8]UKZ48498.1 hypothetical protein TrVGV298_002723 [Trichoderma virens]